MFWGGLVISSPLEDLACMMIVGGERGVVRECCGEGGVVTDFCGVGRAVSECCG